MRGEDGEIHREFVERVARAIKAGDAAILSRIVAELHEADLGDLIAALEPDDRVSLVELTGTDFDFSALNEVDNTVREEILEELEPETVAEGVRELESDDAVELSRAEQEEILERLPRRERDGLERSLDYPENSAGRRMQTDFIAVRRVGPLDKPSTICARRWICRIGSTKSMPSETTGAGRARCRSMRCCVRAGRFSWPT
jgi:magnesium transporter